MLLRKTTLIVFSAFLLFAPSLTSSVSAASRVSNGVACSKSGSSLKTSSGTYKCAKNPLSNSSKLTWLSSDCLSAAKDAVLSKQAAMTTVASLKAQIPILDAGITAQNLKKAEIQSKLDSSTKRLVAAQSKLAAAKSDADKRLLTSAVASWTSATRAYSGKIRSIEIAIKQLESSKNIALTKPTELASNVKDAEASAKLLCSKGF